MWKPSRFNVQLPCRNGDAILVNTLRRSIVRLPDTLVARIRSPHLTETEIGDSDFVQLRDNGIIVPVDMDELHALHAWYHHVHSDLVSVRCTLALTTACNLNCAYCFESGALRRQAVTMDETTANAAVQWLSALTHDADTQHLRLVFYGGEPTLAPKLMIGFAQGLRDAAPQHTAVTFGMYTNGVRFSDDLTRLFAHESFEWAQVALDGTKDVHDRRRVRRNGEGTFNDVWENISTLVRRCGVHVRIVVNFDRSNATDIPCLLSQIADSDWVQGVEVAFNPVFDTGLNRSYCTTHNFPEEHAYEVWRQLYESAVRLGLNTPSLRILDKGPCAIHRLGNLYVSPDGDVFECIGLLGMEHGRSVSVLDPYSPSIMESRRKWIVDATVWPDACEQCSYLPLCLGGCRFKAFCDTGDIHGWTCHRALIETCEFPLAQLADEMSVEE